MISKPCNITLGAGVGGGGSTRWARWEEAANLILDTDTQVNGKFACTIQNQ